MIVQKPGTVCDKARGLWNLEKCWVRRIPGCVGRINMGQMGECPKEGTQVS